jgi:hypothetical protein
MHAAPRQHARGQIEDHFAPILKCSNLESEMLISGWRRRAARRGGGARAAAGWPRARRCVRVAQRPRNSELRPGAIGVGAHRWWQLADRGLYSEAHPFTTGTMRLLLLVTRLSVLLLLATATAGVAALPSPPQPWRHGWETAEAMLLTHGKNKSGVLSADEAKFIGQHFVMHAGGNCDGASSFSPPSHEKAAAVNAASIRRINPTVKALLYYTVHGVREIGVCSDFDPVWDTHPEWRLRNATGGVVLKHDKPIPDCRNAAYAAAITQHLFDTLSVVDNVTHRPLLDGLYSDGIGNPYGVNATEGAAWATACAGILTSLQQRLDARGQQQIVVVNGLDDAANLEKHAACGRGSMVDHFAVLQFVDPITGEWIPSALKELLFGVVRSPVNAQRMLQIKAWPGLLTAPVHWVNDTQPKTQAALQKMVGEQLNAALALFLLVAEDTHFFGYSWFWNLGDFIPTGGPLQTVPDAFFPELECPLGKPLGPPRAVGAANEWAYAREYEHATVAADLSNHSATRVVWHDC